ncbi:serine hydrolase [Amycolatopsis carbonis]|uniref:Serine hydrolase n=1 Tax=Amycolatopsis carbonis TaxID=715471 RepID=A0A9Y2IHW6_9PSEU|nr:serine hydrolase [Amycolatopsis sp. 2-15]WIX78643.1 serine hydrolase [Amycolatopsis sp. 2-15]
MFDDGAGHRLVHQPVTPRPLASAIKVAHAAAYARAVAQRRLDPDEPIRVGDWDARYPYLGDGGSHLQSYSLLGIPHDAYGMATNPDQTVPLHRMAELMIEVSDGAAADYLRARLGDAALRAEAARAGWFDPDVRMFGGETLLLLFPEFCPPPGAPARIRRAAGDRLSDRFAHDPAFRAQVLPRATTQPPTLDRQLAWAAASGRGTARQLAAMHHEIATAQGKAAGLTRQILGAQYAGHQPPGTTAMLFKGGSYPGIVTLGIDLLWPDRRPGTAVLLLSDISPADTEHVVVLLGLCTGALTTPATFADLAGALGH